MYFVINKTKGNISYPLAEGFLQIKPGSNQVDDESWKFVEKNFNRLKVQIEMEMLEVEQVENVEPTASAPTSEDKKSNPLLSMSKSQARKIIKSTFVNAELLEMLPGVDADLEKLINAQMKLNNGEKVKQ